MIMLQKKRKKKDLLRTYVRCKYWFIYSISSIYNINYYLDSFSTGNRNGVGEEELREIKEDVRNLDAQLNDPKEKAEMEAAVVMTYMVQSRTGGIGCTFQGRVPSFGRSAQFCTPRFSASFIKFH